MRENSRTGEIQGSEFLVRVAEYRELRISNRRTLRFSRQSRGSWATIPRVRAWIEK